MMNKSYELATFSHEIKNSLTLIYGQLQYIENTHESLKSDDRWNRMKEDFASLFDLLRQTMSPADTTSAAMEPVDLIDLFKEIQSSWSYQINREHIRFRILPVPIMYTGQKRNCCKCFTTWCPMQSRRSNEKKAPIRRLELLLPSVGNRVTSY